MTENTYQKGLSGEAQAIEYLENRGMVLLNRRYRSPFGEIDIVMLDGDTLVFVEVKARATRGEGSGLLAVGQRKQAKLVKTARQYLAQHPCDRCARFDVIELTKDGVQHIVNAFEAPPYLPPPGDRAEERRCYGAPLLNLCENRQSRCQPGKPIQRGHNRTRQRMSARPRPGTNCRKCPPASTSVTDRRYTGQSAKARCYTCRTRRRTVGTPVPRSRSSVWSFPRRCLRCHPSLCIPYRRAVALLFLWK